MMTQTNFTFDEDLEQIRTAQMAVLAEIDEINMRHGLPSEIEKIQKDALSIVHDIDDIKARKKKKAG